MTQATKLFLIRHAEVEESYHKTFGGRIDMELSPRGHEQAATLARHLAHHRIDAAYASPMKRVQLTLAPLLATKPMRPTIMPGLREVDFGDWTGLGWDAVKSKFGVSAFDWLHILETGNVPNGESDKTFRARVEPCLNEILAAHSGQQVLVASHGGTIRMLLSIIFKLPLHQTSMFDVDYASLTVVEFLPHRSEIQLLNLTPWRDLQ